MIKKILTILILLWTSVAFGTDYYVRPSGGSYGSENGSSYTNAWDGFSNISWSTVDSGNGKLFICGTHTETLTVGASGEDGAPIHVTSCTTANGASTDDPGVISGAEKITGWSVHSGNIYKSSVDETDGDDEVFQVYDEGMVVFLAHEPDTGDKPNGKNYYKADRAEANQWVVTDSATSAVNMRGAYLCIKPAPWFWITYKISSHSGSTINLYDDGRGTNLSANAASGDSYFLLNHMDYLDGANEWFHDESTNTLYVWLSDGGNPSSSTILVSQHLHGIVADTKDWVTIEDLEVKYFGRACITFDNSDNYVIDGNNIHDCGSQKSYSVTSYSADKTGYNVSVSASSGGTISNNTFDGAVKSSIRLKDVDQTMISHNSITDNGLVGKDDNCPRGAGAGISTDRQSNSVTVQNNTVENVGYHGISFYGRNITVNQNYVYDAANVLVDSGGIYCWGTGTDGSEITNNVIVEAGTFKNDTNGIYLDDGSEEVTVSNNTIVGPTLRGIFLHNTKDCTVRYNKFYNVNRGILFKEDGSRPSADYMTGNIVSNNQILLISTGGNVVQWKAARGNSNFGTISNNYYSSNEPGSNAYEYYFNSSGKWQWTDTYSLSEWQNEKSRDQGTVWREQGNTAPADHNSLVLYNKTSNPKIFNYNDYAYDNRSYIYFDTETEVIWPVTIGAYDSKILLWDGGGSRKIGSISPPKRFRSN